MDEAAGLISDSFIFILPAFPLHHQWKHFSTSTLFHRHSLKVGPSDPLGHPTHRHLPLTSVLIVVMAPWLQQVNTFREKEGEGDHPQSLVDEMALVGPTFVGKYHLSVLQPSLKYVFTLTGVFVPFTCHGDQNCAQYPSAFLPRFYISPTQPLLFNSRTGLHSFE